MIVPDTLPDCGKTLPVQTIAVPRPVVIGTAGHIDHGKTSLVRHLTGIDTDRLPEEKVRGISIDLGFASWCTPQFQFGIVDVPGHDRFIKNMVAGAAHIDLALLVVAADDGIMPQTREHLNILDLLGIRTGLVAITKTDLVGPEYQDLVEDEIRQLTQGTVLANCRVVRVSSATGRGMDELQAALCATAEECVWPAPRSALRMPIDQVFTKTGQGTIVTGTVLSGTVRRDDVVEILPSGVQVRVRGVQNHGSQSDLSSAHRRTGVNLAGIKREALQRGDELATPGYLKPTMRMLVTVKVLKNSPIDLQDRLSFRLHLGTAEVGARLVLKGALIPAGKTGIAELRMSQPIVAEYGQRFILRRLSPTTTVAGGTILDPNVTPRLRIKDLAAYGAIRESAFPIDRLEAVLSERIRADLSPLEIACRTGINPEEVAGLLAELDQRKTIRTYGSEMTSVWVHATQWTLLIAAARRCILKLMAEHQPRRSLPLPLLMTALRAAVNGPWLGQSQAELESSGWLQRVGDRYGPAALQIQLSKRQQDLRREILQKIIAGGLAPPFWKELAIALQQPVEKLEPLLLFDVEEGRLITIAPGLTYDIQALERVRRICKSLMVDGAELTVAQLRDAWGVSRKHSIPLCEWLDAQGITRRVGDRHQAGPHLQKNLLSPD